MSKDIIIKLIHPGNVDDLLAVEAEVADFLGKHSDLKTADFKLLEGAHKSWRHLDGHNQLPKLVLGVTFNDGIEVIVRPTDRQAETAAA